MSDFFSLMQKEKWFVEISPALNNHSSQRPLKADQPCDLETTIMGIANLIPVQSLEAVLAPIEQAHGLTNDFYTKQPFFELDRDQVLGRNWACIGFATDLP